jgi:hypothetical protein
MGAYELPLAHPLTGAGAGGATSEFLPEPAPLPIDPELSFRPVPPQRPLTVQQVSVPPIYVNAAATGANSGASWTDAYPTLQQALDAATSGSEIWVAAGVYIPSQRTDPADPLTVTFALKNGVAIYGGFNGPRPAQLDRQFHHPERRHWAGRSQHRRKFHHGGLASNAR